ncbi:MAG: HD domain-containing protein [bacterium]|nr:HD domain-containing protein [bacterium]
MNSRQVNTAVLLEAANFAADKHRDQRRKGAEASPYINHPLAVACLLAQEGGVDDEALLVAALLHDTVEDTDTTLEELEENFGSTVRWIVEEVTDDKSLPKKERKALQVKHAPNASAAAKQLKIADKICNVRDITDRPPAGWSRSRKAEYMSWTEDVVRGCRGVNEALDAAYDREIMAARQRLQREEREDLP